jgi:integrase
VEGLQLARRAYDILTERAVEAAKSTGKPLMLADGRGLYLRVEPSGSRSWILRYRAGDKRRDMGLGGWPTFRLVHARERAEIQRRKLADQIDPIAERRAARAEAGIETAKRKTFREMAETWIAAHEAKWTAKHRADIVASFTHAAAISHMPIAEIDTAAIMRVIEPQWRTKTETMSRLRSRIESVIGYAMTAGYRPLGDNPARWVKHLANLLPAKGEITTSKQQPALAWQELPAFMTALRSYEGRSLRALEFAILTAARTDEAIGATWSEISLEDRVWTIPAKRMKAGREHRVPLSAPALRLLQALPRDGDLVFGPLPTNALLRIVSTQGRSKQRPGLVGLTDRDTGQPITVHGFRATFKTWSLDHDKPQDIVEIAMAHASGDKIADRYTRTDLLARRRRLAEDWADYCDGVTGAKVIPLRA